MILSDLCIRRPVLATVMLLIMTILGAVGYSKLNVELFPDIEFPVVIVTTTYLGAGPEEIEQLVTKPIEDNVSLVENIRYVESSSSEGVSTVAIRFEMGTDIDIAASDVRDKISLIERELPKDADKPAIMKLDPNSEPVLRLSISGTRPLKDIYHITDDVIRTELGKIQGVGMVGIIGGEEREIQVCVRQARLDASRVSISQVIGAIAAANIEIPGGHISAQTQEYSVRLLGKLKSVSEIRDIPIPGAKGNLRIKDVAEVRDTVAEIRKKTRLNGNTSVGVEIRKRGNANTVKVGEGIRECAARLTAGVLPRDMSIAIVTDDSIFIRDVVKEVNSNMMDGIILTALALFLFLHNWRGTFIAALAMPASIIATYTALYLANYSINMMSMMGLAISIGTLVNNAILVLENTHRLIDLGLDPKAAASKGTDEIALAVAGTTLTNVVVFLPIAFMQSIVGQVFKQFAMTVVFATFFSLLISFTLTPMMAALLLKPRNSQKNRLTLRLEPFYARWDGFYNSLARSYRGAVESVLVHPWLTIITASAIFFLVMLTIPKIVGGEFFPETDQGMFAVEVETDLASSLSFTDEILVRVETICRAIPELDKVFATVGSVSSEMKASEGGVNRGEVVVKLVDKKQRKRSTTKIMDEIRTQLAALPGARFKVNTTQQGGPGSKPIELKIRGPDFVTLNSIAEQVLEIIRPMPGLVDVDTDWRIGKPEVALRPNRERMRSLGVTIQGLAETIRANYAGTVASRYRDGNDEHDIRVIRNEEERSDLHRVLELTVPGMENRLVKLVDVVTQIPATGPTRLSRRDREHIVTISAEVSGITPSEAYDRIQAKLAALALPQGYSFSWAGDIEFMQENFRDIYNAMIMATILTFLLLAGLLESWRLSLLIMLTLPIAFTGVFLGLLLRGLTVNIFSLMGMVMLIGLVINNAIVIIDYSDQLRREGRPLARAIADACEIRLRPILMATITDLVAMYPLAMGIGAGGEFRAPMAVSQMGGLVVGGVMSLFLAPALYYLTFRRSEMKRVASSGKG